MTKTPLTQDQLRVLMSNLNPARVATRSQSGSKLSYLEAWDVRATLIRIFGFGGFSVETLRSEIYSMERDVPKSGGGTTAFRATAIATVQLVIPQLEAVYSETAVSSQSGAVPGDVADFAIKTAVSDAMKRCAMNLGTQFGLSLYNKGDQRDVVGILFDPEQIATLKGEKPVDDKPLVLAPDHALEGIGSDDPDKKPGVEVDEPAPPPATRARAAKKEVEAAPTPEPEAPAESAAEPAAEPVGPSDFVGMAKVATNSAMVLAIWQQAKKAGADRVTVLNVIADVGAKLKQQEQHNADARAQAEADAAATLKGGFGPQ